MTENERLRTALMMIANPDGIANREDEWELFIKKFYYYATDIARNALKQTDDRP